MHQCGVNATWFSLTSAPNAWNGQQHTKYTYSASTETCTVAWVCTQCQFVSFCLCAVLSFKTRIAPFKTKSYPPPSTLNPRRFFSSLSLLPLHITHVHIRSHTFITPFNRDWQTTLVDFVDQCSVRCGMFLQLVEHTCVRPRVCVMHAVCTSTLCPSDTHHQCRFSTTTSKLTLKSDKPSWATWFSSFVMFCRSFQFSNFRFHVASCGSPIAMRKREL
jgi:hypothetical protein